MKITRKLSFGKDEKDTLTEEAMILVAKGAFGELKATEKYEIGLSEYGNSTIEIMEKEEAPEEPEAPAAGPTPDINKEF